MTAELICNCTGPWTQTVHMSNPEGHQVGCPRWGNPKDTGIASQMTAKELTLPGTPGPAVAGVWGQLVAQEREALLPHLTGSSSADWLSSVLREVGLPLSATSIRSYRRSLREQAG